MSILDFINSYFQEAPPPPTASGPTSIMPAGYELDPGMSSDPYRADKTQSLKDQLIAMMQEDLPNKEGDSMRAIGRALVGFGHGVGKADPSSGPLGQIGGGVTGGAEGYGASGDIDKEKRASGAKTLFQTLLSQDKVDLQGEIAQNKLDWAQQKEDWVRRFKERGQDYRETSGDRRLDQGDRRLEQGDRRLIQGDEHFDQKLSLDRDRFREQMRAKGVSEELADKQFELNLRKQDELENFRTIKREDQVSQFDERQKLGWTKFAEEARKSGVSEDMALLEYQRKIDHDKQMAKNQDESRSIRERGMAQAADIKKRFGSKADPAKLYLEAQKAISNRQIATQKFIDLLDPTADAEKIAKIQRDSDDFATGLMSAFQNPATAASPAYPAPKPGQPSPGPQAAPGGAVFAPGGKVDVRQQIAAARAKGIPDAAIRKRLEEARIPWPAGM